jgi:hypothetical protein
MVTWQRYWHASAEAMALPRAVSPPRLRPEDCPVSTLNLRQTASVLYMSRSLRPSSEDEDQAGDGLLGTLLGRARARSEQDLQRLYPPFYEAPAFLIGCLLPVGKRRAGVWLGLGSFPLCSYKIELPLTTCPPPEA